MSKLRAFLVSSKLVLVFALLLTGIFVYLALKALLTDEHGFWNAVSLTNTFWFTVFAWADYRKAKREDAEISNNEERIDDLEVQIAITRDKLNRHDPA